MKFLFLLSLSLLNPSLYAKDVVGLGEPGKVTVVYFDTGKVWIRNCAPYQVVKKLSDCHAKYEKSLGSIADIRQAYAEKRSDEAGPINLDFKEMKVIQEKLREMQEYKDAYGNPNLSVEKDPIIDIAEYKRLSKTNQYNLMVTEKLRRLVKEADLLSKRGTDLIVGQNANIVKLDQDHFENWLINHVAQPYTLAGLNSPMIEHRTNFLIDQCLFQLTDYTGTKFLVLKNNVAVGAVPSNDPQKALAISAEQGCEYNTRAVLTP